MCTLPTNDAKDETKQLFYEKIESEYQAYPRNDIKIIVGTSSNWKVQ